MNVRLEEDRLRLRVTRGDLDAFRRTGRVAATTSFGAGARLTYALAADAEATQPVAHFGDGRLTVRVPEALAADWATTDRVGFEAAQPTGGGETLHIAVEKDLGCQHKDDPKRDEKFTTLAGEQRGE